MSDEIQKVVAPKLAQIGRREVSLVGWSQIVATAHLNAHIGKEDSEARWCSMECMARTMFAKATEKNVRAARKKIAGLRHALVDRGIFLVVRYDETPNGRCRILACRIHTRDADERVGVAARDQLERMRERNEVSEIYYQKALELLAPKAPSAA